MSSRHSLNSPSLSPSNSSPSILTNTNNNNRLSTSSLSNNSSNQNLLKLFTSDQEYFSIHKNDSLSPSSSTLSSPSSSTLGFRSSIATTTLVDSPVSSPGSTISGAGIIGGSSNQNIKSTSSSSQSKYLINKNTSNVEYLFYKINHLTKLSGSSTLILNSGIIKDHDTNYGQYLVAIDDDDYILYGDDDQQQQQEFDDQDDEMYENHLIMLGVKNEYRDSIDVSRIRNIYTENYCTFIVMEDESVWVAGNNNNYQLGLGHNKPLTQIPTRLQFNNFKGEKIKKITTLYESTLFLTESGNLYGCGINYYSDITSNTDNRLKVIKTPTHITSNIHSISSLTKYYLLMITKDFDLFVCGICNDNEIGIKCKDVKNFCTKPIPFPNFNNQLILNNISNNSLLSNNSNSNSNTNLNAINNYLNNSNNSSSNNLTSNNSINRNVQKDFIKKISCNDKSILILTSTFNIYVYGENQYGKFGLNHTNDIYGEFEKLNYFIEQDIPIIDIECSKNNCYFLSNSGSVYCSGEYTNYKPIKILLTHYVTELLENDLFIADRGKLITINGNIKNRFFTKYFNQYYYKIDHFDFLCDGKVITVLKSAIYPMDKFSKIQLLDNYFTLHSITEKSINYKKLLDYFQSLSLYDMIQGEYDLKYFEFYFKASSDAYLQNQIEFQKLQIDKFGQNVDYLFLIKKRMKDFIQNHHLNLKSNKDFMFVYINITNFFQNSTRLNELIYTLMIAFEQNITIIIETFIQYLEDTILSSVDEDSQSNEPFFTQIPNNFDDLQKLVIDAFGFVDRKQLPTPATFGRVLKSFNNNSSSSSNRSSMNNFFNSNDHNPLVEEINLHLPTTSFRATIDQGSNHSSSNNSSNNSSSNNSNSNNNINNIDVELNRYFTLLSQKSCSHLTFILTCSILAAIKLLVKSDRVKFPDSKISKDEQIAFQTSMEAVKTFIEQDLKKLNSQKKKKKEIFNIQLVSYTLKHMWIFGKQIIGKLPEFSKGNHISMLLKYLILNLIQIEPIWLKSITVHTLCNGKYVVLKKIASGGEGTVFHCKSIQFGDVAIKKLTQNLDSTKLKELQWNIEQVSNLKHPNIIPYLDYSIEKKNDEYSCCLAMPFYKSSLQQLITNSKLRNLKTVPNWLNILLQICLGLQQIHFHNLIYRDLKNENILINYSSTLNMEEVAIGDFGLLTSTNDLNTISFRGTPITLSPECSTGNFKIDKNSDIFSLGCVFYELLTLEIQITRNVKNQETKFLMHEAIKTDENETHSIICTKLKNNGIPELIIRLVISMLQLHPLTRPTIDTIVDILNVFVNHLDDSNARKECLNRFDKVLLKLPELKSSRKKKKAIFNFLKKFNDQFIYNGRFKIMENIKFLNQFNIYKVNDLQKLEISYITKFNTLSEFTNMISKYNIFKHKYLQSKIEEFYFNDNYYYVTKYYPTFYEFLQKHVQFEEIEIYKIGKQLIEVIQYLHKRQQVHNHLNLENLLFNEKDFEIILSGIEYLQDFTNLEIQNQNKILKQRINSMLKKHHDTNLVFEQIQYENINNEFLNQNQNDYFKKDIKCIGFILLQCLILEININKELINTNIDVNQLKTFLTFKFKKPLIQFSDDLFFIILLLLNGDLNNAYINIIKKLQQYSLIKLNNNNINCPIPNICSTVNSINGGNVSLELPIFNNSNNSTINSNGNSPNSPRLKNLKQLSSNSSSPSSSPTKSNQSFI